MTERSKTRRVTKTTAATKARKRKAAPRRRGRELADNDRSVHAQFVGCYLTQTKEPTE